MKKRSKSDPRAIIKLIKASLRVSLVLHNKPCGANQCTQAENRSQNRRQRRHAITLTGGAWCGLTLGIADTLQQVGITMTTAGKAGFSRAA